MRGVAAGRGRDGPRAPAPPARRRPDYHPGMPHVYLLLCRDGSLYTGATTDLARRLRQNRAGTASGYTRSRLPVELVWTRRLPTRSAALREERRIKVLPRRAKLVVAHGAAVPPPQARRRPGSSANGRRRGIARPPGRTRQPGPIPPAPSAPHRPPEDPRP